MKMVLSILASGVRISAQGGESTPSATMTGTKASGKVTPWKVKAGSRSRMEHTMNAAGKQGSPRRADGVLLMGRLSMRGSSRACCGMDVVHCTKLVSGNTWVGSSMKENKRILSLWNLTMNWLHNFIAALHSSSQCGSKPRSCQLCKQAEVMSAMQPCRGHASCAVLYCSARQAI